MSKNVTPLKPWSLLAYTVADDKGEGNALDASVKDEIKAVCDAMDFGTVSVAVQVDFKHTPGVYRASLTSVTRAFEDIPADEQPLWREISHRLQQAELRVQKESVDLNAATGNVLADFLTYAVEQCPADRYVFFMYGHSSGPMGLFYDRDSAKHVPNTLRLNDLADAMQTIKGRAAVAIFRDCYMANLEAAFQFRGITDFMIASQSEVPIAGIWPWHTMLPQLHPGEPSDRVATKLADALGTFLDVQEHRGPFADAPMTVIDVSAAGAAAETLKALVDALEQARTDPERCRACARALDHARVGYPNKPSTPGDPGLIDVPTMCDNLVRLGSDPVVEPARALSDVVRKRLVKWLHTQELRYQGISLYYKPVKPGDIEISIMQAGDEDEAKKDAAAYSTLALSVATGWDRIALNPLIAPKR